jgi:hypothetical protein
MRVEVYRNLARDAWSIRALEGEHKGRVIAWAPSLLLDHCTMHVSAAGRQRVLRDKRKNVHAFIRGSLRYVDGGTHVCRPKLARYLSMLTDVCLCWRFEDAVHAEAITYNPYKYSSFVRKSDERVIRRAGSVAFGRDKSVNALGAQQG